MIFIYELQNIEYAEIVSCIIFYKTLLKLQILNDAIKNKNATYFPLFANFMTQEKPGHMVI